MTVSIPARLPGLKGSIETIQAFSMHHAPCTTMYVCMYQIIDVDLCCAHHSSLAALCMFEGPWLASFTPPRIGTLGTYIGCTEYCLRILFTNISMESLLRKRPCGSSVEGSEYIGTYVRTMRSHLPSVHMLYFGTVVWFDVDSSFAQISTPSTRSTRALCFPYIMCTMFLALDSMRSTRHCCLMPAVVFLTCHDPRTMQHLRVEPEISSPLSLFSANRGRAWMSTYLI
jgi:hypothetical protein